MRILLVHNTLNDSVSISGVLREYVNMARVWVAEGHTVDFLTGRVAQAQLRELARNAATSAVMIFSMPLRNCIKPGGTFPRTHGVAFPPCDGRRRVMTWCMPPVHLWWRPFAPVSLRGA